MMTLQTEVSVEKGGISVSFSDKILMLGSCFADTIGTRMKDAGFSVCVNPFGTLYNPFSIVNALNRLNSRVLFTEEDCVQLGAGSELFCSFSHHTSFARQSKEAFLETANASLSRQSDFFKECNKIFITLGTAWCYKREGEVVANCLKRNAKEFERERLSIDMVSCLLMRMVEKFSDKEFVFTVSPIRHFKDGAHGNQLSKSTLLLALESVCQKFPERCEYFPAYEIMLDELRDYRFYAEDMLHPSSQASEYIYSRFLESRLPEDEIDRLKKNEKLLRQSRHRPNTIL